MGLSTIGQSVVGSLLVGLQQYARDSPDGAAPQGPSRTGTEWFWLLGVLATLIGATLTVLGLMIQKQAHEPSDPNSAELPDGTEGHYWLRGRWLLGILVWALGNIVCWLALGVAPQCILASINCWNIILTLVIAPWYLGEAPSRQTIGGAALLAVGTAWAVTFGPKTYKANGADTIASVFLAVPSVVAFLSTLILLAGVAILFWASWKRQRARSMQWIYFTTVSAIFAWYSTILSKSTAKMVVASMQLQVGSPFYQSILFWGFAAGFAITATTQIHFLNMGLKTGDAVVVIPTYEAASMTGQIVIGGLVFSELSGLGLVGNLWFWPGVIVVLIGLVILALEPHIGSNATGSHRLQAADERAPLLANFKK